MVSYKKNSYSLSNEKSSLQKQIMFLQKNVHLTSHAEMDQENLALQKHCQTLRMHLENVVKEFATAKHVIKK